MIHRFAPCLLILLLFIGCTPSPSTPGHPLAGSVPPASSAKRVLGTGPALASIRREPILRVRVATGQHQVRITATGLIQIAAGPGQTARSLTPPLTIERQSSRWLIREARGRTLTWPTANLYLTGANGGTLQLGAEASGAHYPGQLVLVADRDASRFHVVNHVPLERYLPGVIYRELYPGWHPQTFEAQAIAARSYALWEMTLRPSRAWDLESTTASQAYIGLTDHAKANHAVAATRGMVLAYQGHVVPAFYCSTVGRIAQDAVVAFPGRIANIAPLVGGPRGNWDQASPHDRWTITRRKEDLARRLAGWGRARHHPIAHLSGLQRISVSRRTRSGQRAAAVMITDAQRQLYELPAESFRQAANYAGQGLPALPKNQRLKSSQVEINIGPTTITFLGQGFGHGVGMSQFGAQAMAKAGYQAPAILKVYYPGAAISRAY